MTDPPSDPIDIGLAEPSQASDLAHLHVEVWRQTYAALAPRTAYEALDVARRLSDWEKALACYDPCTGALVALQKGSPLGVVSFAPSVHPTMAGAVEITHLYVRDVALGAGLGRRLLQGAFTHLRRQGASRIALAVVEQNRSARAFYRRMGGTEGERFTDPGPLWRSENRVVRWDLADVSAQNPWPNPGLG